MKIVYYPFSQPQNKYVEISQNILKKCGCELVDFKRIYVKPKVMKQCSAVILNWYDSVNYKNNIMSICIHMFTNKIKLIILKLYGIKIIFTFHNSMPHDIPNKFVRCMTRRYIKWICEEADYIITLSKFSKNYLKKYLGEMEIRTKNRYIPHPSYIGVYSHEVGEIKLPQCNIFKILFIGQVRKYKNIELILDIAEKYKNKNIEFHIVGFCEDEAYMLEIKERTSILPNVKLDFGFVNDEDLERIVQKHHILILPYDIKSSMNSGTVMLAFSNGRTVICPEICTVKDFDLDDIYTYTYKTEEEHRMQLLNAVLKAYDDWTNKKADFEKKGARLFQAVRDNNNPDILMNYYNELLKEI